MDAGTPLKNGVYQECVEYGGTRCTGPTWTKLVPRRPTWTNLAKLVVVLLRFVFFEKHLRPAWTKLVQPFFSTVFRALPSLEKQGLALLGHPYLSTKIIDAPKNVKPRSVA